MSNNSNYKKAETRIVEKILKVLATIGAKIIAFFKFIVHKGRQRFTVMFIPHSEKKIINFHISVFALVFLGVLVVVLVLGFFGFSTYFTSWNEKYKSVSEDLKTSKQNLDRYDDEVKDLSRVFTTFKNNMEDILAVIGSDSYRDIMQSGVGGGDLSSFQTVDREKIKNMTEISELIMLRNYIDNMIDPLLKIYNVLLQQKELLVDIPNLWPIQSGTGRRMGNITTLFGPDEDPFTHTFRLHSGVDIAWSYGTPIIATANGDVYKIDNNPRGLGLNVIVRHKYGFTTRYGHMQKIVVSKGQHVSRGEIIGYMGSTGKSTGPHVHYEVWMGTQVVDPMHFLDIQSDLVEKYK
ncbi:MAG: M23 family metallopeptidase [Spirochaetales bacterium]|nr:M23 family metallopeptidase [Spirochaetales bacterium]